MKENIIRAILYQDQSVKWKVAGDELKDSVNIHLNVHQKARQFVEVELGDFILSDGEAVLVAFEKTIDGEVNHINPTWMRPIDDDANAFRLQIPTLVHNTPGEWGIQFFIAVDYNTITGEYTDIYPFDKAKFSEYSSFIDDGLTVPSSENLSALYEQVVAEREEAKEQALNAGNAADNAQASATQSAEILQEVKAHTSALYRYKGSLKNYEDLPTLETADIQVGDTYNVENAYKDYPEGTNFAWNGETWDALAGTINVENMASESIFTINAETSVEYNFFGKIANLKKDWGDGTVDYLPNHTYSLSGKYLIKVYGLSCIDLDEFDSDGIVSDIGKSLLEIYLSNNIRFIDNSAFAICPVLKSIYTGGARYIGRDAFCYCDRLNKVVFGESLQRIDSQAFMDCARLRTLEFKGATPPTIDASAFDYVTTIEKVIVPRESVEAYSELFSLLGFEVKNIIDANATLADLTKSINSMVESLPQADYEQNDETAMDYIKNRPFYEDSGKELSWDGSTEGRDSFDIGEGNVYYKISDNLLVADDFSSDTKIYLAIEGTDAEIGKYTIEETEFSLLAYTDRPLVFVVKDKDAANREIGVDLIQSNGTYFLLTDSDDEYIYTSKILKSSTVKKIDEKFLPDFISKIVEGSLPLYSIPFWDGEKFVPLEAKTYADGRQVYFAEDNLQLALQSNMVRLRRFANADRREDFREVNLSAAGGFQFNNSARSVIYGSDYVSVTPVLSANANGTYTYDYSKTIKLYLPNRTGTIATEEYVSSNYLKKGEDFVVDERNPDVVMPDGEPAGKTATYGTETVIVNCDVSANIKEESTLKSDRLSLYSDKFSGVFKVKTEYRNGTIYHKSEDYGNNIDNYECTLQLPKEDGTLATEESVKKILEGLPQKAGWKIVKYQLNHSFSFTSSGINHSGFGSFIEYEKIGDSAKHIITADIQVTSSETTDLPESYGFLGMTATAWKSKGMAVNALFPAGFKDATKYTHMTVDKYQLITDQTEGAVGALSGIGVISPQVYAVRTNGEYAASVWGMAVQFSDTNSGQAMKIDGKHIVLTFYDFHTVTDA